MGHLKEKYNRGYFLGSLDKEANKVYGINGFDTFNRGQIDASYKLFLKNLDLGNKTILDIGCGRGEVVNYCAQADAKRVIGIDFSRDAIKIATEFNKSNHNVELLEMEAKDIEFRDLFDMIFALDVIEHIPDEEMQSVYSKIHLALKNNGLLILNTPFFKSFKSKDSSDFIPATQGMHCNKQTKKKLNDDLIKHKFQRYSTFVWSKSLRFSWAVFIYAQTVNIKRFLLIWFGRISHPKRTFIKLYNRLFLYKR